jgi:hypothetical protein
MRTIEVLMFEGCPNVEATLAEVRTAIAATNESVDVKIVPVDDVEAAVRLRFLGSPTVRVDGIDIEVSASARNDYGLQCRIYENGGRLQGVPSAESIVSALRGDAPRGGVSVPRNCCACVDEQKRCP